MPDRLAFRRFHRFSAMMLAAYLALHMLNHIVGLAGQQQHIDFMDTIRPLYRNPIVEPLPFLLLVFQIGSGLTMVARGWRERKGKVAWAQAISGIYLALFLLNHVTAILVGRSILRLDTDFRFAAAGMHVPPFEWLFAPYYAFAVAALFTHVGCAVYWQSYDASPSAARRYLAVLSISGTALGISIALALSGHLYPVNIPDSYLATYQ
jgi:succinate dehydrogenase/fumarate reductase cytochrome b subunit